jgi:hypothetical protein
MFRSSTLQIYWGWQRNATVFDGFVKSPSAALRFNFVVAAYLYVRFTPQFLRALHLELFTKPSLAALVWWHCKKSICGVALQPCPVR